LSRSRKPAAARGRPATPDGARAEAAASASPLFPFLIAFLFFAVALVPDEKIVRLKLLVFEAGALAVLTLWALRSVWQGRATLRTGPVLAGAAALTGYILLRSWMGDRVLAGAEIRRAILSLGSFCLASQVLAGEAQRWTVFRGWVLGAGAAAVYGILQRFGGLGPVVVPQMNRVMSTFGNPIFLGAFLTLSIPLTTGLYLVSRNSNKCYLWIIVLVIELIALYYSKTRAAWIGLAAAAGFGFFVVFRGRRGFWLGLAALLFLAGLFAWGTRGVWSRDQAHLLLWRDTVKLWRQALAAGVGVGEFHTRFPAVMGEDLKAKWPPGHSIINYAHNEPLQVLAETGAVGLGLWGLVIGLFFWRAHRIFAAAARGRPSLWDGAATGSIQTAALGAAVTAGVAQSFFSVDMRFAISAGLLFFLLGSLEDGAVREFQWRPGVLNRLFPAAVVLGLSGLLFAHILHPYQAQKREAAKPDFFDQKIADADKTRADLEALAPERPNDPVLFEKLAFVYAKEIEKKNAQGQPYLDVPMVQKALAAYGRALELAPDNWGACNNVGNIYFALGEREKALAHWERSLKIKPDQLDARLNLAKVLFVSGRLKESAAHFRRVLELDPGNDEATVYLKRMVE